MAYSKQTWVTGETITASKLNHMEDGIAAISANGAIGTSNLANASVTNAKLDQGAVDSSNIANGAVGTTEIQDGAVTLAKLADAVKEHFALADDVSDLQSALDDAIEDFAVPTQEAVDNWLTDHPEATTTVQDGAITEQKINSNFLPNIFNGAYTIKSFTGDLGTTVNNAFVNNNTVIVPANSTYYSYSNKIVVPSGKTLIILGEIRYSGEDAAIEIVDSLYCKVYVNTVWAYNGTCIRVKSDAVLCEFNEIHSRYLYGKNGIEIVSASSAVQHINFYSNFIRVRQYGISIVATQQTGWNGEIKFFGGEINGSTAIGVYTRGNLTALRMFGVGFESLANILDTENASGINMFGCRNESAGKYIFRGRVDDVVISGDYYSQRSIDISELTETSGIQFHGTIRNINGSNCGTDLYVSPTLKVFSTGPSAANMAMAYYYQDGTVIGADGNFPRVARLNLANGTFALSDAYSIGNVEQIIIYAEKAGIKLTNADGSKTLFTTTDNTSVWRVTVTDRSGYFSPSGFLVEKITPVM